MQAKLFIGKTPQNHLQTLRNYSSLKPYHKTYIISCRFVHCSHNRHEIYSDFCMYIARGQIARDRAMGGIFHRKYGLESIIGGGGGDFLRDQLVWVYTMEYLMSAW